MTGMAFRTAKGPAEVAASPSHGSNLPPKGNSNMDTDTTVAAARQDKPTDRQIVECMNEIEGELLGLVNMTPIMADLLDGELVPDPYGDDLHIVVGRQHMDMCSFAWSDVVIRANAFKERFNAALEGRLAA